MDKIKEIMLSDAIEAYLEAEIKIVKLKELIAFLLVINIVLLAYIFIGG